ncbi:MAG: HAD family hydrolase [Alkalispirochaetaceae bacterium]
MKYRAVVFDLDGTLLNTIGDIAEAMNHALREQGLPVYSDREYETMVGWGLDELTRRALPPGRQECSRAVQEAFLAYYAAHPTARTVPYPGVPALLDRLAEAGVGMAILSNKPDELVQQVVQELLPDKGFSRVLGRSDRFPHKPDPSSLRHILSALGVPGEQACMVGDSEIDMETARNAAVPAVAVSWGFRDVATLEEAGSDVTVHTVGELEGYLLNG